MLNINLLMQRMAWFMRLSNKGLKCIDHEF